MSRPGESPEAECWLIEGTAASGKLEYFRGENRPFGPVREALTLTLREASSWLGSVTVKTTYGPRVVSMSDALYANGLDEMGDPIPPG
jgi:hypothetical protein